MGVPRPGLNGPEVPSGYHALMSDSELHRACRLEEIPDGGAREASLRDASGDELPVVVLREGEQVFAYLNICPHQGRELNFAPDRFMVRDGALMCAHHGATYRVSDGACLGGPCRGAPLRALRTFVQDGRVLLAYGEDDTNAE